MKLVAALVIAGLSLTPFAHAQTVCEEVARINTSGVYRFDSIKGAFATDESEDELYESNATLFGLEDCLIDQYFEPRHLGVRHRSRIAGCLRGENRSRRAVFRGLGAASPAGFRS